MSILRPSSHNATMGSENGISAVVATMTTTASAASSPRIRLIAAQETMGDAAAISVSPCARAGGRLNGFSASHISAGEATSSPAVISATSPGRRA